MTAIRERGLAGARVRDLVARPPVTCAPDASAVEIARLMTRERVGSVVVVGADGAPRGIVTDRDLRMKVVAAAADPAAVAAAALMSSPLVAVPPSAFAFEALLEMTRREIHHLVVVDEDRLAGVVSATDLMARERLHPVALARGIGAAESQAALAALSPQVTALVGRLLAEGASAHDVGQLVAELNDRLVARVVALTSAALAAEGVAAPPVDFCWLALGSEGRREQALRTDQDNALVYADPPPAEADACAAYHHRLAEAVVDALVALGFPPCDGGFMASNPAWCRPLSAWQAFFRGLLLEARPERVLPACIFFDLRPVAGAAHLGTALADLVRAEAPGQRVLLRLLAGDAASHRVPLSLLGRLSVPTRGAHRGTLDVKAGGLMPLAGAGRVHALALGLPETNTVERFRAAAARGACPEAEARDVADAFQVLMRIRLAHQLAQRERGERPDNRIRPDRLSRADRLLLRDALDVTTRVQASLRDRFAV